MPYVFLNLFINDKNEVSPIRYKNTNIPLGALKKNKIEMERASKFAIETHDEILDARIKIYTAMIVGKVIMSLRGVVATKQSLFIT